MIKSDKLIPASYSDATFYLYDKTTDKLQLVPLALAVEICLEKVAHTITNTEQPADASLFVDGSVWLRVEGYPNMVISEITPTVMEGIIAELKARKTDEVYIAVVKSAAKILLEKIEQKLHEDNNRNRKYN